MPRKIEVFVPLRKACTMLGVASCIFVSSLGFVTESYAQRGTEPVYKTRADDPRGYSDAMSGCSRKYIRVPEVHDIISGDVLNPEFGVGADDFENIAKCLNNLGYAWVIEEDTSLDEMEIVEAVEYNPENFSQVPESLDIVRSTAEARLNSYTKMLDDLIRYNLIPPPDPANRDGRKDTFGQSRPPAADKESLNEGSSGSRPIFMP